MRRILPIILSLIVFSGSLAAQTDPDARPSQKGFEAINEIYAAIEKELYPEARAQAQELIKTAKPGSYDVALANILLAQIAITEGKNTEAVAPLRAALATNRLEKELDERYSKGLAQILFSEARGQEAAAVLDRHIEKFPPGSAELLKLLAQILVNSGEPERAFAVANQALRGDVKAPDDVYQIAAAALQQMGRFGEMIPYLEVLAERTPDKAQTWEGLMATYYSAGNVWGALSAFERAREHGHMVNAKGNLQHAELYFSLERYEVAAQLLEEGLKNGSIPNEPSVWDTLVYAYEVRREPKKMKDALERAAAQTNASRFDLRLAQLAYAEEDFDSTLEHVKAAVRKGDVEKPEIAWTLATAAAIAAGKLDEAEQALERARALGADQSSIDRLENNLNQLRQRAAFEPDQVTSS